MNITKRNGSTEPLKLDKIVSRIRKQCDGLNLNYVDYNKVAITVMNGLFDGATSRQIDELAANSADTLGSHHPDYAKLAARIAISSLHKDTDKSFFKTSKRLHDAGLVSDRYFETVTRFRSQLDDIIDYQRDYNYDYFGYRTLERSYLLRIGGQIVERPQHMILRVAIGIWGGAADDRMIQLESHDGDDYLRRLGLELDDLKETYELMSQGDFTHATPTLFNAGTNLNQLASCFLLYMPDSITGIYKTLSDCAEISKLAGGIGISISNVRAAGSSIRGTHGRATGIVPMLKVFNDTARYVNQEGKRPGSFAVYIEPWHADIFEFLDLRKDEGKEELRARDLFYALWTNDMFMEAVHNEQPWYLFSPDEAPGLHDTYGEEFRELYLRYVDEGRYRRKINAVDLWLKIVETQQETGMPYVAHKDSINRKSNQKNVGVIKSSNLCIEIVEFTSEEEVAVCNLASVAVSRCVVRNPVGKLYFDFDKLYRVVRRAVKNLNRVIDVTYYPIPETRRSNLRHRPVAVGIQGLADVFAMLKMAFDSPEARELNRQISEAIYFAAVSESASLAEEFGPYATFEGSPISKGIFQFDMWEDRKVEMVEGKMKIVEQGPVQLSGMWDWESLRKKVMSTGVYNSLMVGYMPTASTSQILGNNETIEAYTSNIYSRRVSAGEYIVINKHLVRELDELGLWSDAVRIKIIQGEGSVQHIEEIPAEVRERYKTVWELKQRALIDMAADRGKFTCQTQSMNLFFMNPNYAKLSSAQIYGWLSGLKTGIYYTRTKSITERDKTLGIDINAMRNQPLPETTLKPVVEESYGPVCTFEEGCITCGS